MKTTLIIDGNYLLNKDVFILMSTQTLHQDLLNLLRIDVDKLSKLYNFDEIYFVSDSKGGYWRRDFFPEYKLGRKYNETIDWEWVYKEYDTFVQELKQNEKIHQLKFDRTEGDDIIAYLINKNNELGYSNMLINSDADLHQLLRFDLSKDYINVSYNYKFSDERVYLPTNYNVFLTEKKRKSSTSLFDMNSDDEFINYIRELTETKKVIEVSTEELLFVKLVHGDKGDNISSVYVKGNKTGGLTGIGKTGAETIYNLYKETYDEYIDFDKDEYIDKIVEVISFNKKIVDVEIIKEVKEKLIRNRRLIKLNEKYLPTDILDNLNKKIQIN